MEIKVLGSGCSKCKKLLANTQEAVQQSGVAADILYVTDMLEIASSGIMGTPGLIMDGKVKSMGRVPNAAEIVKMIAAEK